MSGDTFALHSREEAERFDTLLLRYGTVSTGLSYSHISLSKAWDFLHERVDGGKVFTALLDLILTVQFVESELLNIGAIWNANFSPGKLEGGSILDSEQKFIGKMTVHRHATGFVLRHRAAWDKIMGLLLLLTAPDKYEQFANAGSKKKAFKRLAPSLGISEEQMSVIISNLQTFDDRFRTSEAHGTGTIRKWSLTMQGLDENPMVDLIGYWNQLNRMMVAIGEMVGAESTGANAPRVP